ncbi:MULTISPECIES: hypothetical protein [Aquimarina]|uniref:hypothetical protein n=1 Tax=Aquimarina TaxID=290174 RepID=UPI0009450D53|nr:MULTISPECIES: hypothetical protein [Aquimarina]
MKKQASNSKKLNLKKLEITKLNGLNTIYGGAPHHGKSEGKAPTTGGDPEDSCQHQGSVAGCKSRTLTTIP